SRTRRLSSPRRLEKISPWTATRSPRSQSETAASPSSPSTSSVAWSCSWPVRSARSRKIALPCPRRPVMRPASHSDWPDSAPASSPPWSARTCATSARGGVRAGYGSTPARRMASTFAIRSPRIPCSTSLDTATKDMRTRRPGGRSGRLDVHDLQADGAGRRRHLDRLALLVPEQRAADRGLVREPAVGRIGLGGAHDLVRVHIAVIDVLHPDLRADGHDVFGDVLGIDDAGRAQLLLQP